MAHTPVHFRGFLMDVDQIDDRTMRVHCSCGAQAVYRDNEYVGQEIVEDGRTGLARAKIAEIEAAYPVMQRSVKGGRVSRAMMATKVGIDRDTITDWTKRGWMSWPPDPKNPRT
jgi:hypothetical protein